MAVKPVLAKKKKKGWYEILSPESMGRNVIGESTVYESQDLVGRTLKLNLSIIMNDMKKQNIDAEFEITSVKEGKAETEITGLYLTQSYMKRMVRRGKDKVDDSFLAVSKDKKTLRVKPVIITNSKAANALNTALRLKMRELVQEALNEKSAEEFFSDLVSQKFQRETKDKLSKIYPLRYIDVRQALEVKNAKTPVIPVAKKKEKDVKEKAEEPAPEAATSK